MENSDFDAVVRDSYGAGGELDRVILQCLAALSEAERDGRERPETISRRSELGDAYRKAGRIDDAIDVFGQVVADMERLLGATAPDLPVARGNLAAAFQAAGRLDDAIATYIEAVAGAERVLGPTDATTLICTSQLAGAYRQAGRIDDAIPLYLQAMAAFESTVGPTDVHTLSVRNNLAGAYLDAGRVDEALSLLEQVAAELTDTVGADDPRALTARSNLAAVYDQTGRFAESIPLHQREVSERERSQGPDHPDTARARISLGSAYLQAGRTETAIPLFEAALAGIERTFDPGHRDVVEARDRLALAYHAAGRTDEAIALLERVVADVDRWFDADHPDAISVRNHLGSAYQQAGRSEQAIPLLERVAADRERLSGSHSVDALDARNALATAHFEAGRPDTARTQLAALLADCERAIPDAELTAVVRDNLAAIAGPTPDEGTAPPAGPHDWQPPTDLERALYEAARRDDRIGYLRLLAGADLYVDVDKVALDAEGEEFWKAYKERPGVRAVAVRTIGEVLPPRDKVVVALLGLRSLATRWPSSDHAMLVNPGTPAEMSFPAGKADLELWAEIGERFPPATGDALLTKYTGPRQGPLAHAFGCGAHLAVRNRVPWNDLADAYIDYRTDQESLRESWDVTTTPGWQSEVDALLSGQNSPPQPEFALGVRRELIQRSPDTVTADGWRQACADTLVSRGASPHAIEEMVDLVGKIVRYEARFRADGLLPPHGFTSSAIGYDFGRAVNVARWGLGARLCTAKAAHWAIFQAGKLCREHYGSWAEFSAGYALGRVIRFDSEEFGDWYDGVLTAHRILMSAPDSPWLTIPWRQ